MNPATKTENEFIMSAKLFAHVNDIPFSKMTELVVLVALRQQKEFLLPKKNVDKSVDNSSNKD